MFFSCCWISNEPALPEVLQSLPEGWAIKQHDAAADIEDSVQALFCDAQWPDLETLCRERQIADGPPPLIVIGDMNSVRSAHWIQAGADDVLAPSKSVEELHARTYRLYEKSLMIAGDWQFGLFIFRLLDRTVMLGNSPLDLNAREYLLLLYLARAKSRVVSKTELLSKIWRLDFDPGTNRIEVYIFRLRMKLAEQGGRDLLRTVKGEGYLLEPE